MIITSDSAKLLWRLYQADGDWIRLDDLAYKEKSPSGARAKVDYLVRNRMAELRPDGLSVRITSYGWKNVHFKRVRRR